jgi:hypothetical protein
MEKVDKEKRKYLRSKCMLPAELLDSEGRSIVSGRVKVKDFSHEGLKLSVNFAQLKPGSSVDLKVYLPEKKMTTSVSAEITWDKYASSKLELGLKIKDMNKETKAEILRWLFPSWVTLEPQKNKKTKKKITKKKTTKKEDKKKR